MSDNEKLIEEALVALAHDPEVPTGVRPHLLGGVTLVIRERTDAEPIVRVALDVFAKSRAPQATEEDRAALAFHIGLLGNPVWDGATLRPIDWQIADALIDDGFHR